MTYFRRKRHKNEPRWIRARYPGRCSCGKEVKLGDNAYYYPYGKTLKCRNCGRMAELEITDDDINRVLKIR